jgi:DNA-binding NarL/FixJ family response regulator
MSRPTTLIADDHEVFVEGLQRILDGPCELVGTVRNGLDLVDAARRLRPEVIVSDVSMPVVNGIEAVRQLIQSGSRSRVVMLSMHDDKELAMAAIRAGAKAYVLKTSPSNELLAAIREALAGKLYVTPAISRGDMFEFEQAHKSPQKDAGSLTARETEVLQLVAEGKALKEIAAILNVAIRTVVFHKSNVMQKLALRSTAELTQYAIRRRLICV